MLGYFDRWQIKLQDELTVNSIDTAEKISSSADETVMQVFNRKGIDKSVRLVYGINLNSN
jgi:hypothetical protein